MTPGQKAGGNIAASERRQPLIDNYPIWLAAKFIPDYFDDETVRRYVIRELDKTRRFYRDYRGKGPDQPWLGEAEVKDRNPELAAPEYMDRYKALIRDFTAGLSTRARAYYQIGAPNYNVKTGRMHFGPSKEQTNLALDRNLITDGVPMPQRDAERFLNHYANRPNASARIDIRVKDAVRMLRAERGQVLVLIAEVEEVRLYSPVRPVRVNGVPTGKSELVASYAAADLPPASDSLAEQRAADEKKTSLARTEAGNASRQQQTQIAEKTRKCEASGMPQCWGALCKLIASRGDRQKMAWCKAQRKQSMLNYSTTLRPGIHTVAAWTTRLPWWPAARNSLANLTARISSDCGWA